jgi:microcystin-dependent protein
MAPSAVNDSARAMMARTAEWRDDISGTLVTAGTSTAYTLATNQGFDNLTDMNGAMIAFVPHTTNGATVTLAVDGLSARPLRSAPGVDLTAGVIVQGTPYVATYNNSDGAFYLQGFTVNPYVIPVGGLLPYVGASAPNSAFVLPFGQAISRTTYAALFGLVGGTFGGGDGSTTFNVPDLRGRAVFGQDNMGGSAAGRITAGGGNFDGTVLGNTGGAQNHTLTTAEMPSHTHANALSDPTHHHNYQSDSGGPVQIGGAANATASLNASGGGFDLHNDTVAIAAATTTGITITNAAQGGGGSHTIMPPAMMLPFILRII